MSDKLKISEIAERENTSIRTVYRWLDDGLVHYDLPGGIKVAVDDLKAYLEAHKCQSGRIRRDAGMPQYSEGGREFIESARKRRRGGMQKTGKRKSAEVLTMQTPEPSQSQTP